MNVKISKIINFKPWHIPIKRMLNIVSFGVCAVLAVVLFTYAGDFIVVYSAVSEAEQYINDDAFVELRRDYDVAKREQDESLAALDKLSQSGDGVALDQILAVAMEFRSNGINVLSVGTNAVTGYGPGLDTVTRFMNRLSEELGREVDIKSILQLELNQTVVGFDLRF